MSYSNIVRNILVAGLFGIAAAPVGAADMPGAGVGGGQGRVCFYESTSMTGEGFCAQSGESNAHLGDWSNRILSLRVGYGAEVDVCTAPNYRNCTTITSSVAVLPWLLQGSITSFEVR